MSDNTNTLEAIEAVPVEPPTDGVIEGADVAADAAPEDTIADAGEPVDEAGDAEAAAPDSATGVQATLSGVGPQIAALKPLLNPKTLPAFGMFYMAFAGGQLSLVAGSNEFGIRQQLPAIVTGEGALLLPRELPDLMGDAASVEIIGVAEDEVQIKAGAFKGSLKGLPSSEYPAPPATSVRGGITLSPAAFTQLLNVAGFASHGNRGVPMEGLLLSWKPSPNEEGKMSVTARAVDQGGTHFAVTTVKAAGKLEDGQALVLAAYAGELEKMARASSKVKIGLGKNHLLIQTDSQFAWCGVLEGRFPDLTEAIAKKAAIKGVLPTGVVTGELRRIEAHLRANGIKATDQAAILWEVRPSGIKLVYDSGAREPSVVDLPYHASDGELEVYMSLGNAKSLFEGVERLVKDKGTLTLGFISDREPVAVGLTTSEGVFLAKGMPVSKPAAREG